MIVARRPRFFPTLEPRESTFVGALLRSETVGGGIALAAAAIALVWANLDTGGSYDALRSFGLAVLGGVGFTVSLLVSDLSFTDLRGEDANAGGPCRVTGRRAAGRPDPRTTQPPAPRRLTIGCPESRS
jgi:hypothetical protein